MKSNTNPNSILKNYICLVFLIIFDFSFGDIIVPTDYSTIQAAIDAANPNGDLIIVLPGTYYEDIEVNKPLEIRGIDSPSAATIHGTITNGPGQGIIVIGMLTISNNYSDYAIDIFAGHINLYEVIIEETQGISVTGQNWLQNGEYMVFRYLDYRDNSGGIKIQTGSIIKILDSSIYNNDVSGGNSEILEFIFVHAVLEDVKIYDNTMNGDLVQGDWSQKWANVLVYDNTTNSSEGNIIKATDGGDWLFTHVTLAENDYDRFFKACGGHDITIRNSIIYDSGPIDLVSCNNHENELSINHSYLTYGYNSIFYTDCSTDLGGDCVADIITGTGLVAYDNLHLMGYFENDFHLSESNYNLDTFSNGINEFLGAGTMNGDEWNVCFGNGTGLGCDDLNGDVPTVDLDGNPRPYPASSNPDIGAYESIYSGVPYLNADFSSSIQFGDAPLGVSFYDQSIATNMVIADYYWSFGDGSYSTQTNPSKSYTQAGTYTVSLTVSDSDGNYSDTEEIHNYITVVK